MTDPVTTVETDVDQAKTDVGAELAHAEAFLAPAVTDIKALLATRAGDLLIAAIVLGAVFIGHAL